MKRFVRRRFPSIATALALLCIPGLARSQSPPEPLQITLAAGTAPEQEARDQLRRIVSAWDLSRWLFTRNVQVHARAIPHSHPVLTVNTAHLRNDTAQVATFVHEQLHWFLVRHQAATDSAIAELARLYPTAPDGPPAGARDLQSTYLHLLVCLLEFEAVRDIFDEATARRTLGGWPFYPWIYKEVLERPTPIREVLRRHALDSPDARR